MINTKTDGFHCDTSSLKLENGKVKVPAGRGTGVEIDPDVIRKHKAVTLGA